jgi:antitoxin component YwqK of YwqJK toxin-antitoxin module
MQSNVRVFSFLTFILVISMVCQSCQAKTDKCVENKVDNKKKVVCTDCNKTDKPGKKFGLWIEDDGLTETYYKNGLKHGIYKKYFPINGKLQGFGEFRNGRSVSNWYHFDEQSKLLMIEKNITKNTDITVTQDDGKKVKLSDKSYITLYYPNGIVREEGIAVYNDDAQIGFYKFGLWKYYDETGNLIKTKIEDGDIDAYKEKMNRAK